MKIETRWVAFDDNNSNLSLNQKQRPAIILPASKGKGVYIIPLTSVEKPFYAKSNYAISLKQGGYALVDQFEKVSQADMRIKNKININIDDDELKAIFFALENFTANSISNVLGNNLSNTSTVAEIEITVGTAITFTEELANGKFRSITATVKGIDSSISKQAGEDYCVLSVHEVKGSQREFVYKQKNALIRTREHLIEGIKLFNSQENIVKPINRTDVIL